jgi:hypothetical protein
MIALDGWTGAQRWSSCFVCCPKAMTSGIPELGTVGGIGR